MELATTSKKQTIKSPSDLTTDDRWELLKANGMRIESILLHQPGPVFTATERTINSGRPKFKNLKMWRTPTCYLLELDGKREIIEVTSVFSAKPLT